MEAQLKKNKYRNKGIVIQNEGKKEPNEPFHILRTQYQPYTTEERMAQERNGELKGRLETPEERKARRALGIGRP